MKKRKKVYQLVLFPQIGIPTKTRHQNIVHYIIISKGIQGAITFFEETSERSKESF